jgi:hypothetical protein
MLINSLHSRLLQHSDRNIARLLGDQFPGIQLSTLRKDIAKAKKLARLT